jgi:hypothetical protein
MLHHGPPPLITVPTGRAQLITAVPAEAVQQELTAHLQLLPNREVLISEALPQEAAAAVTAAVAHPLQGVIHRAVRAAPEAAGHLHLRPHQVEGDNLMLATILSINEKVI